MFQLELKLEVPSHTTAAAIEEGWKRKEDPSAAEIFDDGIA